MPIDEHQTCLPPTRPPTRRTLWSHTLPVSAVAHGNFCSVSQSSRQTSSLERTRRGAPSTRPRALWQVPAIHLAPVPTPHPSLLGCAAHDDDPSPHQAPRALLVVRHGLRAALALPAGEQP